MSGSEAWTAICWPSELGERFKRFEGGNRLNNTTFAIFIRSDYSEVGFTNRGGNGLTEVSTQNFDLLGNMTQLFVRSHQ
jgi:hypothetical protein